ncbi:MAG TPA: GNAT family N-acetyltransferase, partial [Alphaproteobacteria bacterium]|nr:GNAT family N-acetyltransferase [Alphaproteobacteria bacterium]
MDIRKAAKGDCRVIAELALIAGEGIPAYFWEQEQAGEPDLLTVGARKAGSETDNFSYRNTHLALIDDHIAGMVLAYRLPESDRDDDSDGLPDFIHPLLELERRVPGSFYVNMLA